MSSFDAKIIGAAKTDIFAAVSSAHMRTYIIPAAYFNYSLTCRRISSRLSLSLQTIAAFLMRFISGMPLR